MNGKEIDEKALFTLFEAAKWAPSSYNNQFWRFIYAMKGTKEFDRLFNLLLEGNQVWAKNGGALIVILSHKQTPSGKPARTHSFDTGMAWMNFLLQCSMKGLVAHTLEGFDYKRARKELHVPPEFDIEAMAVVGHPGDKEALTDDLKEREFPKGRRPLSETIMKGAFKPNV